MKLLRNPNFIAGLVILLLAVGAGIFFNHLISEYPEWSSMYKLLKEVRTPVVGMLLLLGFWFIWMSIRDNKKYDWIVVLLFLAAFVVFTALFIISLI
ncbi:MAG TPA: hypothetical protein GX390_00475 [Acholeplasmataceae bacterium]|jgi:uncharacterized membrane protein|nr:hypothetical protein [Acholeplasmataceae bacterium]